MTTGSPKAHTRKSAKAKSAGLASMVNGNGAAKAKLRTLSFGSITLTAGFVEEAELDRNIGVSQQAMKKIKARLIKPGVKLRASQTIPLFRADPANPGHVIRTLNGKRERGVFEGGTFKVLG